MTTEDFWTPKADKPIALGHEPGNPWEELFRRSVEQCWRKVVEELGEQFEAYLQVPTADAMRMYDRLIEQGMLQAIAPELALADLLPEDDS